MTKQKAVNEYNGERVPDFIEFIDVQCLERVMHWQLTAPQKNNEEFNHNLKPSPIKMKIRKITLKTKPSMFFFSQVYENSALEMRQNKRHNTANSWEGYPRGCHFFQIFFTWTFPALLFLGEPRAFNHICLPTILTVASMSKDGCAQGEQRLNGVIGLQHKGIWLPPELRGFRGKLST